MLVLSNIVVDVIQWESCEYQDLYLDHTWRATRNLNELGKLPEIFIKYRDQYLQTGRLHSIDVRKNDNFG